VAAASPADVSRVAIIGDSLTRGYGVNPDESYASLLEAQAPGDNVLPLAHDGATVRTWNTVYRSELGQLAGWRPSSVLIALGGNDYYHSVSTVQYQANLTELIGTVRAAVPGVRVILWHYYRIGITPVHNLCDVDQCQSAYPSPTWDQYAAAMRNEAVAQFTGYIDNSVERPWLALYPLPGEFPHIHLSWQGHRALEQSLYPRLFNCC
jgi:lysophospholipase L1-like esterase